MPRRGSAADLSSSFLDPSLSLGSPLRCDIQRALHTMVMHALTPRTEREGEGEERTHARMSARIGRRRRALPLSAAASPPRVGGVGATPYPARLLPSAEASSAKETDRLNGHLARVPRRVGELNGGLRCGSNQAHQVADASRNPRCESSGSPFSSKRCLSRVAPINQQKMTLFFRHERLSNRWRENSYSSTSQSYRTPHFFIANLSQRRAPSSSFFFISGGGKTKKEGNKHKHAIHPSIGYHRQRRSRMLQHRRRRDGAEGGVDPYLIPRRRRWRG